MLSQNTSEIFVSKTSFLSGRPEFVSKYYVKEKYSLGWSRFAFQANGIICLRLNDGEKQIFKSPPIFGFLTNGIQYFYNDSSKVYIALVDSNAKICIFVGEQERMVYKGIVVNDIYFYSKGLGREFKTLDINNLERDYSESSMLDSLKDLIFKIKKEELNVDMHMKQFIKLKHIVKECLSNF